MKKFFVSIGLLLLAGWVQAEELQVCVDPYPPFKIVDRSGRLTGGIDIELTNALLEPMGIKAEYTVFPWVRCLHNLEFGQADFVSGITKNAEREKFLYYIEPPYKTTSVKVFYVNKGDEAKIRTYEDIQHLTIGILRKAKYFEQFDNDDHIKKYEISDEISAFKMLKMKRLDAFITTEEVGDFLIKQNGYGDDFGKAEYKYNQKVAVYFALSKKSKFSGRLPDFMQTEKTLTENGTFDEIIKNYSKNKN